jgi:hypothetical protein
VRKKRRNKFFCHEFPFRDGEAHSVFKGCLEQRLGKQGKGVRYTNIGNLRTEEFKIRLKQVLNYANVRIALVFLQREEKYRLREREEEEGTLTQRY